MTSTHSLGLDGQVNAYVTAGTTSPNWPTTPGTLQTTLRGGQDWGVAKFSPTGALLAGTFIGGDGTDGNTDGVYVDDAGNVMLTGTSISANFPTTPGAYQTVKSVGRDAAWVLLKADFSEVLYGTFVGGASAPHARVPFIVPSWPWPPRVVWRELYAWGRVQESPAPLERATRGRDDTQTHAETRPKASGVATDHRVK